MTPHPPVLSEFFKTVVPQTNQTLANRGPNYAKEGLYTTFYYCVLSPSRAPSSSRYAIRFEQVPYSLRKKYSERKGNQVEYIILFLAASSRLIFIVTRHFNIKISQF